MKTEKRLFWADNLKALCIIFVYLVHAGGNVSGYVGNIVWFIMMPMFFLLSGYFKKIKDAKSEFKKILETLALPSILCGLLFNFVFTASTISAFINQDWAYLSSKLLTIIKACGGYWFLTSLIIVELLFLLIYFLPLATKNFVIACVMVICLLYPIAFEGVQLPYNLHATIVGLGFFCMGRLLNEYESIIKIKLAFIWVLFILYVICVFYYTYSENAWVDVHLNQYCPLFMSWSLSLIGTLVFFLLFKNSSKECKIVGYIGQNTLILYMVNGFVFQFCFYFIDSDMNGTIYGFFVSFMGLVIGLFICVLINKFVPWLIGKRIR